MTIIFTAKYSIAITWNLTFSCQLFSVEQNDKNIDAEPTLTTLRTNLSSKSLSNGTDKNWKYWCIMRYMNHSFFRHVTIILIYLSRNRSWEKHVSHNYNTLPHHPRWLVWSNRTRMTHSLQHTPPTKTSVSNYSRISRILQKQLHISIINTIIYHGSV